MRMDILIDFFTNGFDGSGADNFFDAGNLETVHDCYVPTVFNARITDYMQAHVSTDA